jgi:deoxycytidylate deaminase
VKALMLENRQIIIDGFNQYQNGGGHCAAPEINGGSVAKVVSEC